MVSAGLMRKILLLLSISPMSETKSKMKRFLGSGVDDNPEEATGRVVIWFKYHS